MKCKKKQVRQVAFRNGFKINRFSWSLNGSFKINKTGGGKQVRLLFISDHVCIDPRDESSIINAVKAREEVYNGAYPADKRSTKNTTQVLINL